jgi:alpha,alpha-trehalase
MFEKYSDQSLNEAGSGGEYEVVVGFGWSNGVLIWTADTFRDRLQTPACDGPLAPTGVETNRRRMGKRGEHGDGIDAVSAVELDYFDATWTSENVGGLRHVG